MNAQDILTRLGIFDLDAVTAKEIAVFIERKIDEQAKIKGQIARDLSHLGEWAFRAPKAYDKLKAKYKPQWTATKKLAILDDMRKRNCERRTSND